MLTPGRRRNKSFLLLFFKKEESSFSEEKGAKNFCSVCSSAKQRNFLASVEPAR
jgi:hypothetical protein